MSDEFQERVLTGLEKLDDKQDKMNETLIRIDERQSAHGERIDKLENKGRAGTVGLASGSAGAGGFVAWLLERLFHS